MPPRVTKAQLQAQVDELEAANEGLEHDNNYLVSQNEELKKENKKLKDQVRRGNARSRSPRRPATSAEANVELTCRALRQVSLWQQDTVVQEHRDEIQRLREELAKKDEEIARLRRGEGPIGEVLVTVYTRDRGEVNNELGAWAVARMRRQTTPVHEFVRRLTSIHTDLAEVTRFGGTTWAPATLPRAL
jgi:cell division protein FtsB